MSSGISQQQLESYLWGAAVLLRGTIDAGDYKQFIFPLLFFKRLCDVYDEETQAALAESGGDQEYAAFAENHRFQIPPGAHWRQVRTVATDVGRALQNALRAIETANPSKLYGIFGDAQWTNKDRLSDAMLRDLVEHFSSLDLTLSSLPEDELGQGYEYLIKKFADDSGHTAAEFYTNRTVVHLMTEMLDVQPGEAVYDPTCGSGGMLLSCIAHLRRQGKEWRNVRLYGQERNLMTSAIARMNCFLHGIEDFTIERGDTLSEPRFVQGDRLMQFDVVLANPPYSIKQWERDAFAQDPWGRNVYGTPPQGRADYAFWQHILASLAPQSGRCAILFPHGVLFRQEEAEMRRKLVEADLVECVLGLGPNLFYNSPMEACVVVCRTAKPTERRGKILFINAVNEVTRERAQSYLTAEHIERIVSAYQAFSDEPGLARAVGLDEIRANGHSLKIDFYVAVASEAVEGVNQRSNGDLNSALSAWTQSRLQVRETLASLFEDVRFGNATEAGVAADAAAEIARRFDRSKWQRVRFRDVVRVLKEKVDPQSGEVARYVAGEHMDSENVHIRRWGTVGDGYLGPAFIRRFRKGQVLYGSRRTYLKKVAMAEFDGVTANTTLVLEVVEGKLLQELLPWLMLSERFTEHSMRESKGSTNPYINWPDIAKFEFALPPLDQQRHIAEMLWAMDAAIQQTSAAEMAAQSLADASLANFLYDTEQWSQSACRDILLDGPRNGFSPLVNADGSGLPTLSISAIRGGEVVTHGSVKFANVTHLDVAQFQLQSGDILVVRGNGNRFLCGKAGIVRHYPEGCFYPDLLIRLRFKPDVVLQEFAVMQWNEPRTHARLISRAKSTNGIWKINGKDVQSHRLVVPPIAEQERFLGEIRPKRALVKRLSDSVGRGLDLRKQMANAILGGPP